jgi:hypothetical protein
MMVNETYNDVSCGRMSKEIGKFSKSLLERSMVEKF